ncbi:MAG: cobalamin B12-binding protein, partial [Candidatus Omnitrophica bacterium]|nr:cobalamin B12-binding protein [Candidatus Omnitrophota bacterium]
MAQVVLIRPPFLLPSVVFNTTPGVPPIGIAYLAGSLKAAGHKVQIIDSFGASPDRIKPIGVKNLMIAGLDATDIIEGITDTPSAIGISCMFSNDWLYVKTILKKIRERFPFVPIITGGEHVTGDPKYALESAPEVDIVVMGEGEKTLLEIISLIEAKGSWKSLPGIVFRDDSGGITVNLVRHRIKELDTLPWPDWEDVPLENYLSRGLGHGSSGGRIMPILASRGCPFRCSFCTNSVTWQARWIARSPVAVIEEMAYYIGRYQITQFEFADLTIALHKEWIMDFCRLFMDRGLRVAWTLPSGTRTEALDKDVLKTMFNAGCRFFCYAPE